MRLTKKYYLFILSAFLLVDPVISRASDKNEEIVDRFLGDLVIKIDKSVNSGTVAFDFEIEDNIKRGYLKTRLGNEFGMREWNVYRNFQQEESFQGLIFEIRDFDVDIRYSRPLNQYGAGEIEVQRNVQIIIKGQVFEEPGSKVIFPIDFKKTISDTIEINSISEMENSPYPFMTGSMREKSHWEKYFEPALLMTTIITVILLFYTQRI